MSYPKIRSVKTMNNHTLLVRFDNGQERKYNVASLLTKKMFAPLKNPVLFRSVEVEQGGYAITWNNDIDISEYELWRNGRAVP